MVRTPKVKVSKGVGKGESIEPNEIQDTDDNDDIDDELSDEDQSNTGKRSNHPAQSRTASTGIIRLVHNRNETKYPRPT